MKIKFCWTLALMILSASVVIAKENKETNKPAGNTHKVSAARNSMVADCKAPSKTLDMDINNVRAKIFNSSDMWWDIFGSTNAAYQVPKGQAASSLFAGSIWIGGMDPGGALKVAGQTYRQNGTDFWNGPLDANGEVDAATCKTFDRIWEVRSSEITAFKSDLQDGIIDNAIPDNILEYPAKGNPNAPYVGNRNMAPFKDANADGVYNPGNGDYPILSDSFPNANPDQIFWWIFNDKGGNHGESNGDPIGIEVHAQAFAFSTNNAVNDMTFLRYLIINKANTSLNNTYMGFWTDADLGDAADDFVGCDTALSLGICYNGDAVDGPANSPNYGNQPPMVGIDYFKGPRDDNGKLLGMTSFMYFNNDGSVTGNPGTATDFYYYMQATWKNGIRVTYGGTGYDPSSTQYTNYMFASDPNDNSPTAWSECSEGNAPFDRRFVQASGPFTLKPGATNEIIVGVPWVRPPAGTYPCPSFDVLRTVDKIAQALFDNKFELIKGPPAPGLTIVELDQELIITISDYNATETFKKVDPVLANSGQTADSFYVFQGYKIYQLKDNSINNSDLSDPNNLGDKAKLLYSIDIYDTVITLTNWIKNQQTNGYDGTVMVTGENKGIRHTFRITDDAFAQTAEKRLVNFNTYYYMVVPYSFNNWKTFDPNTPTVSAQTFPYLEGEASKVTGIPHKSLPGLASEYGNTLAVTRIEGRGNGGNELDFNMTANYQGQFFNAPYKIDLLTYKGGFGPINVKVYDPLKVVNQNFTLEFENLLYFWLSSASVNYNHKDGDTITNIPATKTAVIKRITDAVRYDADPSKKDSSGAVAIFMLNGSSYFSNDEAIVFSNGDQGMVTGTGAKPLEGWLLRDKGTQEVITTSKMFVSQSNEQVIFDERKSPEEQMGISIHVVNANNPGVDRTIGNGFIGSSIEYANSQNKWLTGVQDNDVVTYPNTLTDDQMVYNWIMAGQDATDYSDVNGPLDPDAKYETVITGTWAPYALAATVSGSALHAPAYYKRTAQLGDLSSVIVVLTPDRSKWSRCVVIETGYNGTNTIHGIRIDQSLDVNGNQEVTIGKSWFPGYAVNLETGERLNIFFGENSRDTSNNGGDMKWNPTSSFESEAGVSFGGKHYLYVMKTNYDECTAIYDSLVKTGTTAEQDSAKSRAYRNVIWTSMPYLQKGYTLLPYSQGVIPNEATIKIKVTKPFDYYQTTGENYGLPKYEFSSMGLEANNSVERQQDALSLINVVPNPYYSYSLYESSSADKKIKITNLPQKCTITIYALNGALIKQIKRDNPSTTYEDWNLTNFAGVPVSSGVYIIHINADGLGEKVIKWFGVMRPADLANF